MRCSSCGTVNPVGARFCHQCGTRLSQGCPACGFANLPEARFCNNCGARLVADEGPGGASRSAPEAPAPPVGPAEPFPREEERRPVTILFVDLVGFTELAERLDPEEVRELTAITLGRLAREITQFGGTIDKFIGDAILALFGAPISHGDDAERAVGTALAMQGAMAELNETLAAPSGKKLAIRIGINTGQVVVGAREVGGHYEYTAIGDPVNVASRLQTAATPGAIVVGEATFRQASRSYAFLPLAPLTLRGKADPVPAYQALGSLEADGSAGRDPRIGATSLVGREQELASLRYCLDQLQRGRGQIAFVVGEAGLGKTRLVAELGRECSTRNVAWAQARAFSYGQHLSFGLFNGTIRNLFPIAERDGEQAAATALRDYLVELDAEQAYPFLSYQLGLPVEPAVQAALASLSPPEFQARLLAAIRRWIGALARRSPLVFVGDDVHWADPSSLSLLDGLLEVADEVPIFFCFLMRPERDTPAWQLKERAARDFPHRYTEVVLQPLDADESRAMLGHLLQIPPALARVEREILAKAEGNPLYLEEVVHDLVERGVLAQTAEGWAVVGEVAEVHVPDNLQSAIIARVDRLRDPVRHVIQTAAVAGRAFNQEVLASVLGYHPTLDDDLREAQRAELIREVAVLPVRQYAFKHALVQEAVYNTLLVKRRRELHAAVGRAIEALYAERLDEYYEALAHHYAEAEVWPRAAHFAVLAGDRAGAGHANREALAHYQLAWRSVLQDEGALEGEQTAELLEKLGDVQALLGLSDEAVTSYQRALERRSTPGQAADADTGRVNVKLAGVAMQRGDPVAAEGYLNEAFASLSADHPGYSSALSLRSGLLMWWNDYAGAAESARRALELARAHGSLAQLNQAFAVLTYPALAGVPGHDLADWVEQWLATARAYGDDDALYGALCASVVDAMWVSGRVGVATLQAAREAREAAERLETAGGVRAALALVGGCLYLLGRWTEAEAPLRAAPGGERTGGPLDELGGYWLGMLLTARGRLDEGRQAFEQALHSLGFPHSRIWLNQGLAWNREQAGDLDAARAALELGGAVCDHLGCLPCGAYFSGVAAELWATIGDADRAAHYVEQARRQATLLDRRPTLVSADRAEAALLAGQEKWEAAAASLRRALKQSQALDQPFEVAQTSWQLAQVLARLGRAAARERARRLANDALGLFQTLGAELIARRAEMAAHDLGLVTEAEQTTA